MGDLVWVDLPAGLREIPDAAFESCFRLMALNLADTQTEVIGTAAFWGCMCLLHLDFPDALRAIGPNCFVLCPSLWRFNAGPGCAGFTTLEDGQVLFSGTEKPCWPQAAI